MGANILDRLPRLSLVSVIVSLLFPWATAQAQVIDYDDETPGLDAPYDHHHPLQSLDWMQGLRIDLPGGGGASLFDLRRFVAPRASNLELLFPVVTPVKNQGPRGVCSIFSAMANLETQSLLRMQRKGEALPDLDKFNLSEEWLQGLINIDMPHSGSDSQSNLIASVKYGVPSEEKMPYIAETWESINSSSLARERCGSIPNAYLNRCLLGHRDPRLMAQPEAILRGTGETPGTDVEFADARAEAQSFRAQLGLSLLRGQWTRSSHVAKEVLVRGQPVLLDIDFYYGAWNHRTGPSLGIDIDTNAFHLGRVGTPIVGSADRAYSNKKRSGHSVLLIGYDDDYSFVQKTPMTDGSIQEHTVKGVYIFKNSWGTSGFGSGFTWNGREMKGYGVISQEYVESYGQIFVTGFQL